MALMKSGEEDPDLHIHDSKVYPTDTMEYYSYFNEYRQKYDIDAVNGGGSCSEQWSRKKWSDRRGGVCRSFCSRPGGLYNNNTSTELVSQTALCFFVYI